MIVQTDPRAPRVVLVGPPGAGKSTIGRRLARELGVELYDTDAGIESETGRTIPEIFADDGEPEFRRIEERVVRRAILAEKGVVSLGGGAVLSENTRALLRSRTVVYLEISVAEGLRRTGASTQRPLLNSPDPGAKYRELMRRRRPLYREVATVRVRTDGRSPGRVVRMILTKLGMESVVPAADPEPDIADQAPIPQGSRRSRARRRARARAAASRRAAEGPESGQTTAADTEPPTPADRPTRPRNRRTRTRRRSVAQPPAAVEPATDEPRDHEPTTTDESTPTRSRPSPRTAADIASAEPLERSRSRRVRRPAGAPDTAHDVAEQATAAEAGANSGLSGHGAPHDTDRTTEASANATDRIADARVVAADTAADFGPPRDPGPIDAALPEPDETTEPTRARAAAPADSVGAATISGDSVTRDGPAAVLAQGPAAVTSRSARTGARETSGTTLSEATADRSDTGARPATASGRRAVSDEWARTAAPTAHADPEPHS